MRNQLKYLVTIKSHPTYNEWKKIIFLRLSFLEIYNNDKAVILHSFIGTPPQLDLMFWTKYKTNLIQVQRALLNGITDNVINWLMWPNLSRLTSPFFLSNVRLSSFDYYYRSVITISFSVSKWSPISNFHFTCIIVIQKYTI